MLGLPIRYPLTGEPRLLLYTSTHCWIKNEYFNYLDPDQKNLILVSLS